MPMVTLSEVSLSFGARTLLERISFTLGEGRKIALAGANGSGKSTLMKIMARRLRPDAGAVIYERDTRVSYLPQSGVQVSDCSLYEEAEKAFAEGRRLEEELGEVAGQLAAHREESAAAEKLLRRYHELQEKLQGSGYERREEAIERVLTGLGFAREEFSQPASTFSEGWQMRIALARVLLEGASILLLDEPTNFLDLEARAWLEEHLKAFPGGALIVSHDRYFLDVTVAAVAEIYRGRLTLYPGNYTAYARRRGEELAQTAERYERQQEDIARVEAFINRFRYNASKARQVQSRIRQLESLERIEPPPAMKRIRFSFPEPPHSGRRVLNLEGVSKLYGGKRVLREIDLELSRGEKLALVGPNGTGKSTLMRIMAGREEPSSGRVRCGTGVTVGFYSPDQEEALEASGSVIEQVESWAPTGLFPALRGLLGAFLFRDDDIHKPVSVLSGGEASRLAMLKLLLHPANLLFLDEPTNHLDMVSKDVLLDALTLYAGTLVFVSHDRYFLEALATRVLEIQEGRAIQYPGDYAYYLWRKSRAGLEPGPEAAQRARAGRRSEPAREGGQPAQAAGTDSRREEKQLKAALKRLGREEEEILAALEELHREASGLEEAMARPENYQDGRKMKELKERLEANRGRQEELTSRWSRIEEERRCPPQR